MQHKCTTSHQVPQQLIAGLIEGSGIEFFGIKASKEVKWIQNGHVQDFKNLPPAAFVILANAYRRNEKAKEIIEKEASSLVRQVELYAYYCYGSLDHRPDLIDGQLQEPENFRHSEDCPSLEFKTLKINGQPLKPREIEIIDLYMKEADAKDEVVAMDMGITRSTLNQHKAGLYAKAGVASRPGIVLAALKENLNVN